MFIEIIFWDHVFKTMSNKFCQQVLSTCFNFPSFRTKISQTWKSKTTTTTKLCIGLRCMRSQSKILPNSKILKSYDSASEKYYLHMGLFLGNYWRPWKVFDALYTKNNFLANQMVFCYQNVPTYFEKKIENFKFLAFSLEFQKFFSITRTFFYHMGQNNFGNKIQISIFPYSFFWEKTQLNS